MSEPRPLEYRGFAHLGLVECEWEPNGKYSICLWEPVHTDAPLDARPNFMGPEIQFYKDHGKEWQEWRARVHDFGTWSPTVVMVHGREGWWSIAGGSVQIRDGKWMVRWTAYCNGDISRMLMVGWPAYHNWKKPAYLRVVRSMANPEPAK